MANPEASYRDETGHFIRWSVQHRHAAGLTYGTIRVDRPRGTLDTEKRWADARRLLHDDTLPTPTGSPDCCWSSTPNASPPSATSPSTTSTSPTTR